MKMFHILDEINHYMILAIIQMLDVQKTRTEEQQELIKYSLSCIVNEFEKIIFLVIFFTAQNRMTKFLIVFLGVVS